MWCYAQGDLLVHVMEVAKEELAKPAKAISRPRLQSLLELAIKTSSIANDPHQDDVSFTLDPRTLMDLVRASLNQTEPGVLKVRRLYEGYRVHACGCGCGYRSRVVLWWVKSWNRANAI